MQQKIEDLAPDRYQIVPAFELAPIYVKGAISKKETQARLPEP
jgi:hypothetical protein